MGIRSDARLSYSASGKKGTYKLADLIQKRPSKDLLAVGAMSIELSVQFPKDVGATAWKKYYAPKADAEAQRYQKVMEEEAAALAKKIEKLKKSGELEKAERMVTETTHALNNAAKTLKSQLPSIINAELSKQGKRDKELRNARIVLTFKAGRIVVTLGANVAKLVGSGGTDVSGWISLTKQLKAAGELIYQQTKNEKKLREDLHKAYKKFIDSVEGTTSSAEGSLKTYRNHSTKTKNNVLSTSKTADKLQAEMKKAKGLKDGVKLGAKMMQTKRKIRPLIESYDESEVYADAYEKQLEESKKKLRNFVTKELSGSYDKLVAGKDGSLDKFVKYAEQFLDAVDEVAGLVGDFKGAAG